MNHTAPKILLVSTMALASALFARQAAQAEPEAIAVVSTSTAELDAEYEALAHDVAALDRELGIFKRVAKLVSPTVVHIEATPLPKYRGMWNVEEAGSGVVVQFGPTKYILTNRHVVRRSSPELIDVHLADGRIAHPTRLWSDDETDVAVLAIDDVSNLEPARLGDSDALETGEYVVAVGSPFGLSQSVTRGIVSAKGRHNLELGDGELKWQNFIQTDAAINPGNSGGPLMNLRGEVVGINTAIASGSGGSDGIGFAIPINIAARIARELIESNSVSRGFLGVELDDRFTEAKALSLGMKNLRGTRVTAIEPGSPAESAQLQVDDVIVYYDGILIERYTQLISLVKLTEVGKRVDLVFYRDGQRMHTEATIGNVRDYSPREP